MISLVSQTRLPPSQTSMFPNATRWMPYRDQSQGQGSLTASRDYGDTGSQSMLGLMSASANPSRSMIDASALGAKSAANTAYGAMIRNLSRMGVNPQSPRFAGQMRKWAAGRAAMEAGARGEAARAADQAAFGRYQGLYSAMQGQESQNEARMNAANQQANAFNLAMINRADARRKDRMDAQAKNAEEKAAADVLMEWRNKNKPGLIAPVAPVNDIVPRLMNASRLYSQYNPVSVSVLGV